jgi:hypothetical protein
MTTISRADEIAKALKTRLQAIRKNAGYHTDIGLKVYRGKRQLTAGNCATLYEGEEDAGRSTRAEPYTTTAVQHFVAEAAVECDPDNPDIAGHKATADLLKALFTGDATLGALLAGPILYTGRVIQPRLDGQALVLVQIKLDATYSLTPANP